MGKQMDFMKGLFVRIPPELTTDPFDKRGEIAVIDKVDYDKRIATVRFNDDLGGQYQFDALEILCPLNALLYRFQMHFAEMKYNEIETVRQIIKSSRQSNNYWALQMACFDEVIKGICVVDCETFYDMHVDLGRSLGVGVDVNNGKKNLLSGRTVRISHNAGYRTGEFGVVNSIDTESNKVQVLMKEGSLLTYDLDCLETLHPLSVLIRRYQKLQHKLTKRDRKTVRRVIANMMMKQHLWAIECAVSKSLIKDICVTDLKSYYDLKKAVAKKMSIPKTK